MQLQVRDVAALFEVTERTVHGWVREGSIPAHSVNAEYRFSRSELLEWATGRRLKVPPALFDDAGGARLADALAVGGAHTRVPGADVREVLAAVVERLPLLEGADRASVLAFLLAREATGSTAIGDGVAIPHLRAPLVLPVAHPIATACWLERPLDLKAPDGQPVRVLFTLVSPTVRAHLQLLARLACALRTPEFRDAVARTAGLDELVRVARRVDDLAPGRAG